VQEKQHTSFLEVSTEERVINSSAASLLQLDSLPNYGTVEHAAVNKHRYSGNTTHNRARNTSFAARPLWLTYHSCGLYYLTT
jgi:hypothetical protein